MMLQILTAARNDCIRFINISTNHLPTSITLTTQMKYSSMPYTTYISPRTCRKARKC